MTPTDGFDAAMGRADHLLCLYDVLHNSRSRAIRTDWAARFLDLMHWPTGEAIVRVDGKDKQSLLILRPSLGLDHTNFTHDYLSELLRSAEVATVSALDRYVHDLVLRHAWALLRKPEARIPTELKALSLFPCWRRSERSRNCAAMPTRDQGTWSRQPFRSAYTATLFSDLTTSSRPLRCLVSRTSGPRSQRRCLGRPERKRLSISCGTLRSVATRLFTRPTSTERLRPRRSH